MDKQILVQKLNRITEFSLYVLLFFIPISKSMIEMSFAVALICWFIKRILLYSDLPPGNKKNVLRSISGFIRAFKPLPSPLNLPIAVFTLFGFLSMSASISLSLSLEGFFFKLFEWIMIYFIVAETIDEPYKFKRTLFILIFSMALVAINGMFQFIVGWDFIFRQPLMPANSAGIRIVRSSFSNPNGFACWLLAMIPVALSMVYLVRAGLLNIPVKLARFKKPIKNLPWILVGLLITCLILTYSRGGWATFPLSIIFLGIIKKDKNILKVSVVLLALLAVLFFSESSISNIDRFALWQEAISITEDFPLLGVGLNTYSSVAPHYKVFEGGGVYPHNSYLHMSAESGLLGVASFFWITVILFKTALSNLKRLHNLSYAAILVGLLTGLFGFLMHCFVDTNIYSLQLGNLMWFIMGLIVAAQKVHGSEIIPPREA